MYGNTLIKESPKGNSMAESTVKLNEIDRELHMAADNHRTLYEAVEELNRRLGPVLRNNPESELPPEEIPPTRTKLGSEIRDISNAISRVRALIVDILERLEV